jgi:hypothetical protein
VISSTSSVSSMNSSTSSTSLPTGPNNIGVEIGAPIAGVVLLSVIVLAVLRYKKRQNRKTIEVNWRKPEELFSSKPDEVLKSQF